MYEQDCNQLEDTQECRTIVEEVCSTDYVTPSPAVYVTSSPAVVDSYGNPIPPHRRFKRQYGNSYSNTEIDSYGVPEAPPTKSGKCSCSQAECTPGEKCILCPIGHSSCAPLPCSCTEEECLPGQYCNLCAAGEEKCGGKNNCRKVPREVCRTVSKPVCREVAKNVCIPVAKPVEKLVTKQECIDEPTTKCRRVTKRIPQKKCTPVHVQKCRWVVKNFEKTVEEKVCRDITRKECTDVPRVITRKVPKETKERQCFLVPNTECKQVEVCILLIEYYSLLCISFTV